ncbi:MAG TPA: IS1595 family transposase [Candidatus Eremiobacteraceae bacterium]|nr:IS1595 family transposase [Candidatus Eremiobacteraceae bacterium]
MNLLKVTKTFTTEDAALDYLIKQRWPKGVRCLACDHDKVYTIATKGKTGKPCRLFECGECKLHFSATTGTLFHDSHLPLQKWFMAMALMAEAKKGISANQVARHIGVQYKTAWHLCHRIRKAMEELNTPPLGGQGQVIEIDETYLGGKKLRKGVKAGKDAKIAILGIAEHNGRVHLQRISNAKAESIRPVLDKTLSPNASQIITDAAPVYSAILPKEKHKEVNHREELRTLGELSTKTIDGAFSLFKRGVIGSFHHLSEDHLDSYLQEFCWRYNRRHLQQHMFETLTQELMTKKPLTYRKLTRETF